MADAFLILRRVHLFSGLGDEQLRQAAALFSYEEHEPDVVIFHQGDGSDAFFLIEHGTVAVVRAKGTHEQTVATLKDGDYFGELGLIEGRPRSAGIQTVTKTGLWRLSADDFFTLLSQFPAIKDNLNVVVYTRKTSQRKRFAWLEPDEVVYLIASKQQTLFWISMLPGFFGLLMASAAAVAGWQYLQTPWALYLFIPVAVIAVGWMIWHYIDWDNDLYIVTNKRVIDYEKIVLLYDSRIEAPLTTCRNVNVATDQMGRIFGYGNVIINTFSGNITFHYVPNPKPIADLIQEQINRQRSRTARADRESLKRTLRQSMGLEKPLNPNTTPLKPAPRPPRAPTAGIPETIIQAVGHFNFRVRTEVGGVVTYHKHPLILLRNLGLPLLLFLGLLYVLGLRAFGSFTAIGGLTFFVAWLVPALAIFFWGLYQYEDWRNDIYQVSAEQIVDITRKPLGQEVRKTASIGNVLSIKTDRPGLLALLLNFGTVVIQTGPGGEMQFRDVLAPLEVQQDIFRHMEARQAKTAADQVAAERDRLAKVLGAFYEITLDDQRDRLDERQRALDEEVARVDGRLKDIHDRMAVMEQALMLAEDEGMDEIALARLHEGQAEAAEEYKVVALRRKALEREEDLLRRDRQAMTEAAAANQG